MRDGFAQTTAAGISQEAGMSKATFYAHFDNKESCVMDLVDLAAQVALRALVSSARGAGDDHADRHRAGLRAFLTLVATERMVAQAVLVEYAAAGPRALAKRETMMDTFAEVMYQEAERGFQRTGGARFATQLDALAVVGAIVELVGRQLRRGDPQDIYALEPVIDRLLFGVLTT